jgi:8-hydroxy-5-deazaflavin:NADPH oxidoreductase
LDCKLLVYIHLNFHVFFRCNKAPTLAAFKQYGFQEFIMKIAVLGTGMVGQTLAAALVAKGHHVMIGTRDVAKSLATTAPNVFGMPAFGIWHKTNSAVSVGTFEEAATFGDVLINASNGSTTLETLALAKLAKVGKKILIDVSNDLDFSKGMPPKSGATDIPGSSLGERIQTAYPTLRVVKTLNTMSAPVMVNPAMVPGDSTVFMSGNDADAKKQVHTILSSLGWTDILDLGGIATARGVEMLMPLWLATFGVMGKPNYNFKIVR